MVEDAAPSAPCDGVASFRLSFVNMPSARRPIRRPDSSRADSSPQTLPRGRRLRIEREGFGKVAGGRWAAFAASRGQHNALRPPGAVAAVFGLPGSNPALLRPPAVPQPVGRPASHSPGTNSRTRHRTSLVSSNPWIAAMCGGSARPAGELLDRIERGDRDRRQSYRDGL